MMDYECESKEIVSEIERMVHGYDSVELSLHWGGGFPRSIATDDELVGSLFELSLKSRIIRIRSKAEYDELNVELVESTDGGTNITADVIEKIGRYLGRYDGEGVNFLGQHSEIGYLLKGYRKYLRKNRRILLRDVTCH